MAFCNDTNVLEHDVKQKKQDKKRFHFYEVKTQTKINSILIRDESMVVKLQ